MQRRSNTALFFALTCALLCLPGMSFGDSSTPNIIIILTDDMGYGDISANGNTPIRTPNIDRLAAHGVNFSSFYASANVCTPSRAGLLTGRYAIRSGLAAGVLSAESKGGLPQSEQTIAELAKRAGLQTALIGKWHLGAFPDHHPMKHGWDTFYGTPHSNDMANFALFDGNEQIENPVEQSTLTQRYTSKAMDFIDDNAKRPFLLMLSHNMPHIPLYASKRFRGQSHAGTYGDVIEELDDGVGRIVKQLQGLRLLRNTLIIFTSDNGPFFEGSVANLKGGKGNGWDGGYRVPGVISWPKEIARGRTTDALASHLDILPTLADILQQQPMAETVDGNSLLPLLRGEKQKTKTPFYYFNNEEIIGIRNQHWKLLTHVYYRRSLGAFEKFDDLDGFNGGYDMLFDMRSNGIGGSSEQYSLADRHPKVLEKLKAELHTARKTFKPLMRKEADKTFPE